MTLLARKGVSPNDYVQNPKSFCKELPSKSAFYLKLDNEDTSDEDYEHAQNVWALSKHKTIKDYNDLYLQSDVLICYLLMYLRILEKVVPPGSVSPGLAWDACLKQTGQSLELSFNCVLMIVDN